jgi:hypothetical protein
VVPAIYTAKMPLKFLISQRLALKGKSNRLRMYKQFHCMIQAKICNIRDSKKNVQKKRNKTFNQASNVVKVAIAHA